jgi:hypothetical protein
VKSCRVDSARCSESVCIWSWPVLDVLKERRGAVSGLGNPATKMASEGATGCLHLQIVSEHGLLRKYPHNPCLIN